MKPIDTFRLCKNIFYAARLQARGLIPSEVDPVDYLLGSVYQQIDPEEALIWLVLASKA